MKLPRVGSDHPHGADNLSVVAVAKQDVERVGVELVRLLAGGPGFEATFEAIHLMAKLVDFATFGVRIGDLNLEIVLGN